MAVSKLWAVTSRLGQVIDYAANPAKTAADNYTEEQYQALRDVLAYAKDEEKTEREFFVEGINCNPLTARDQFVSVKQAYGKEEGIQAYHGYLSFKEQDISPELAQKIGMEFVNEVWGKRFQAVVTTHLNTKHLHCHYVINSVSFVDGKRLWGDEKAWFKFRLVADKICEKYGLYYNPNPNRSKQSSYYYKQEQAGMPTRYSMTRQAIDEAIAHSTNLKSLDYALTQMGYEHCLSESRSGMIDVNHTLVYYDHRTEGSKKGCYFNVNTTKTPASMRQVPMLDFVKEAFELEKQKQKDLDIHCEVTIDGYSDFIFINRFGQAQHQATLNKAIRRIIRDCNDEQFEKSEEPEVLLPHFSCHSLRHTFTTRMCEAGVNIKVIQDALGHTDISTTLNIYTDVTKELKTSEFKGLDNYFKAQ